MVNPQLLWFLPLALVPILLHLITLHSMRTIELSTFRFLMDSYVQQRRRARLLEFLVMILRLAFVGLVVFFLARPVVHRFAFLGVGGDGKDVVIVIDASPSMAVRSSGTTSFERARSLAGTIINMLVRDDHLKVIRAGRRPQVLVEGFAVHPERIAPRMDNLRTDTGNADLPAAIREAFSSKAHGRRVVYLLTNGLRSSWSALAEHPVLENLDAQTSVVVMNVGTGEPIRNVAVVGEPPEADRVIKGLPVLLDTTVVNSSAEEPTETVLSVMLDDELVRQINLTLEPRQRITRSVSITPNRSGLIKGRFQLPADAYPEDNTFLFCLNVAEKLDVLLVTGPTDETNARSAEVYVKAALKSPQKAKDAFGLDESLLAAAINVISVKDDKLTDVMLNAAEVAVFADVPMDVERAGMLRRYVESGGGIFILPGAHSRAEDYNEHLLDAPMTRQIRLAQPVGNEQDESNFMPVGNINLGHHVLNVFAAEDADYFSTVKFYRYFPIEVRQERAKDQAERVLRPNVLMRLANRTPILAEIPLGEGKVIVAGFAATANWSNLPLKPEFVPMLLRTVAYLQRRADAAAPAAVAPSQPAPIRLTDRWSEARVQAIDPTGKPHKIQLRRSGRSLVGAMLQTEQKGFYTYHIFPHSEEAPERVELGFAVNLSDKKSDFTRMSEDQIREILAGASELAYLRSMPDDTILAEQLTGKREIWRTLIWLCFVVIGAEFFVATLRPRRELAPIAAGSMPSAGEGGLVRRSIRHVLRISGAAEQQVSSSTKSA